MAARAFDRRRFKRDWRRGRFGPAAVRAGARGVKMRFRVTSQITLVGMKMTAVKIEEEG